jgi:hypothetical protein
MQTQYEYEERDECLKIQNTCINYINFIDTTYIWVINVLPSYIHILANNIKYSGPVLVHK